MKKIPLYALAAYGAFNLATYLNLQFGSKDNWLNARVAKQADAFLHDLNQYG